MKRMLNEDPHLSDQEILQAEDGELSSHRTAQVHAHLAACWNCRARMAEIEGRIADFTRAHRETLDPQLPPVAGPRALLKAQLAGLASERAARPGQRLFQFASGTRAPALICLTVLVVVVVGSLVLHPPPRRAGSTAFPFERGAEPDRSLTPGATRRVTVGEVCTMPHEEVVVQVSTSLRQEVLQEYGIVNASGRDYEIDYLITPGLGGVEDIHNLWPEPYASRTWNARVKDALEERLHEMVCAGKIDLPTAQRDIATDWIAAYKKYFHTVRPLSLDSRLDSVPVIGIVGTNSKPGRGD
jgi:hypothetical protein